MTSPTTETISVRVPRDLYDQARNDANGEYRNNSDQIEYWARVGRAALDNLDLPVSFIAEALDSLAEPRELASPFKPRKRSE
jgi:hypothetical protein